MKRELKLSAIQVAMQQMIRKGHFSVCEIDSAAKLLGVSISSEDREFMHLLHCVNFSDMPDDVKQGLQEIIERTFSSESFTITIGKNWLGREKKQVLSIATA